MKTNPFFTAFKPIEKGDKLTVKPAFMDPGDENYTFYSIEDQLEGMDEIRMRATRNATGEPAIGIQSIRFEMLVMEPRETGKTTYATIDEVKAAAAAGVVVHYDNSSYTVKQSKFDPEEFFIDCINGHRAFLGDDYKPEDFYSVNSLDAARSKMTPAEITLDDQLSNLERDLTGLPNDDPRRVPIEKEFRRVKREINAKAKYGRAVMSCFNHLALGEIRPTLTACEQFVGRNFELPIGGAATEAAFDAMRKFGMSVEDILSAIE